MKPQLVATLFRKHADRVRRTLGWRLRNPDDGADAAQETFLRLWRQEREGKLREDGATAYLNAAAGTIALDVQRWRNFHVVDRFEEAEIDEVASAAATPEEAQHWRDALVAFVEGIDALPDPMRDVFLLYHVTGLTYAQIAAQLGISSRTAERHLAMALVRLHHRLKDYL